MKQAGIIILCVVLIITGLDIASRVYVEQVTQSMREHTYALTQAVAAEDYREAHQCYQELTAHWVVVRSRLSLLFEHSHVDQADVIIARIEPTIRPDGGAELASTLAELMRILDSFPEQLRFTLVNIL